MNHTTNYNLNQWEDGDVVRREDFNADNAAIDAALAAKAEIVFGYYMGNGDRDRVISLGRTPKIVIIEPCDGVRSGTNGGIAALNWPTVPAVGNVTYNSIRIVDGGFEVAYVVVSGQTPAATNVNRSEYYYIAIF